MKKRRISLILFTARNSGAGEDLSQGSRIAVAASAGACSSLIGSPAEMVMIQQQRKGGGLLDTAKQLLNTRGLAVYGRGMVRDLVRD